MNEWEEPNLHEIDSRAWEAGQRDKKIRELLGFPRDELEWVELEWAGGNFVTYEKYVELADIIGFGVTHKERK